MLKKSDILLILAGIGLPVATYFYVNRSKSGSKGSIPLPPVNGKSNTTSQLPTIQPLSSAGNTTTYRSSDLQELVRALQMRKGVYPMLKPDDWWGESSEQALYGIAVRYGIQNAISTGYNSLTGFYSKPEDQFVTLERKYEIKDRVVVQPANLVALLVKAASNGASSSDTTVVSKDATSMVLHAYVTVTPPWPAAPGLGAPTVADTIQQVKTNLAYVVRDLKAKFGAGAPQITGEPRVYVDWIDGSYHIVVQYPIAVTAGTGTENLTNTMLGAFLQQYLKDKNADLRNYMKSFELRRISNFVT